MTDLKERYHLRVKESLDRKFTKLAKKDPAQMRAVGKKSRQLLVDPHFGKPLRAPMQHLRRAHIGSFVLTYRVDDNAMIVRLIDYEHHDKAY